MRLSWVLAFLLVGCTSTVWQPPDDFSRIIIDAAPFQVETYQKISDNESDIHIYIEGDGHAFDKHGRPTTDPTPHSTMLRDIATRDTAKNVAYIARPCQFIMSDSCTVADWTDGRFSERVIDAMAATIKHVAGNRPIVLIGYSGGAMVSGLVISRNPKLRVRKWITIAGVLDHRAWTNFFNDLPLTKSLNMEKMPNVPQLHYVGGRDRVVPSDLVRNAVAPHQVIIIQGAGHNDFSDLQIDFK